MDGPKAAGPLSDPFPERDDAVDLRGVRERLLQGSAPRVLVGLGIFYAASGASIPWVTEGEGRWAFAASTVGLGVAMAALAEVMRRRPFRLAVLEPFLTTVAALLVAHALAYSTIDGEPGESDFASILLAGAGFVLPSVSYLAGLSMFSVAAWVLLGTWSPEAADPAGIAVLLAGSVVGLVGQRLRGRTLHRLSVETAARERQSQLLAWGERRFQAVTETAQDAILCAEATGTVSYLNPAASRLFGVSSNAHANVLDLLRPGAGTSDVAGFFLRPRMAGVTAEAEGRHADGTEFPAEVSAAAWDQDGRPAFTLIVRDISARKAAEEAARSVAAQNVELEGLRRMNAMKTRLLNTAAHELNTPLTPIRLQLHLLHSGAFGALNERQERSVDTLDRNISRLAGLVAEILDVARVEAGRLKLETKRVELSELLFETSESFQETARQVGLTLQVEPCPGLLVLADRNRVIQVLFNLVSNAIKFTPSPGSITVRASVQGDHAEVIVEDTGIGFGEEQGSRLFQPFSQIHDPTKIDARGTGLGLYISKGIVEAHGGEIRATSKGVDWGSLFRFTLPLAGEAPTPTPAPVASEASGAEPRLVPTDLARRLRELI